ncbi:MAG: hypothetical protein ACRD44_19150 [Bryobacteraceae bacterium]
MKKAVDLCLLSFTVLAAASFAQTSPGVERQILDRLTRLEEENRALRRELDEIRREVAGRSSPRVDERLDIQERRIDEQAQSKVEAAQKFPIRFSGMLLANLFRNGTHSGGQDTPTIAARNEGRGTAGLTLRQSIFGMEYHGPSSAWGSRVRGSMSFDFFDGFAETGFPPVRLRTADITLDWASRSLSFALDKPLISLRDPSSLSYSGVSPLTGSGNLWRWHPQIRFEQRATVSESSSLHAQFALVQTTEESGLPAGFTAAQLERRRPGLQGRLQWRNDFGEDRRFEVAPSFHVSRTHIAGASPSSRVIALDWLVKPARWLELSGLFWGGQNVHHFGALRQGFTMIGNEIVPVHSRGGWGQVSFPVTGRVTFNVIGGVHDDRNRDLVAGGIDSNRTTAINTIYRLAPNVLMSLEALRLRTVYVGAGGRTHNRYDLAVAYLF